MSEVELEEDEWTFAEEAWGEQRIGVHTLEVLHRPGIQQAIDHNVDLEKCYASRIAIRKPHLTKDTAATLVRLLPAEVWDHGRVYWNLGLDHYQYDRDFGTHNITLYMVDRHLDQSVYTGPGATRPQLQLRLHRFPMEVVQTPDWIQHEWTRSAGKSLSEDEDDGRRRGVGTSDVSTDDFADHASHESERS